MASHVLIFSIFFPLLFGLTIYILGFEKKQREIYTMAIVLVSSVCVYWLLAQGRVETVTLFKMTSAISIAFRIDNLSRVFALLLASLWPIATLYAFEYMEHEGRENTFFALYTSCYGVTLGICFAANLITMYLFYELLTLITVPLIMHSRNEFSRPAGIKYIAYSIAGATSAFAGIMIIFTRSGGFDFAEGGILSPAAGQDPMVQLAFVLMFLGFGVKAAVFPLYEWLPAVGIAPTPVTALLHAVAVVKSGCFAIMRVTYYIFGAGVMLGSFGQKLALFLTAFTIAFGSIMAYRETHFKRRLAMSTVANLSYILFGAMLMTPLGLIAACLHMLFHGVMKICLFFVAGATHIKAHADYVTDLDGFGRKMPVTFAAFTVASLALTGIPPFCGFYSKMYLGFAAVQLGSPLAYFGIAALLVSALFTAIYLLSVCVRAYFPGKEFDYESIAEVEDPSWKMKLPFIILAVLCLVLGLMYGNAVDYVKDITTGLF